MFPYSPRKNFSYCLSKYPHPQKNEWTFIVEGAANLKVVTPVQTFAENIKNRVQMRFCLKNILLPFITVGN